MLHAYRHQALSLQRKGLAVDIQRLHSDFFGAGDLVVNAGHGKAALLVDRNAIGADDARVDKDPQIVALFRNVDHQHLQMHIHLRCCQADARRGIHGLSHIGHQFAYAVIYLDNRFGNRVQTWIGVSKYCQFGHLTCLHK
ncbi:hypothetical protein GALL_497180 [mine drainage metagenome]|uniref:Uncharacterized protein n=1 Tax=mine drainage metagenome TaxID=410659 RepID=A0A1J5PD57_9ZZZZ